MLEIRPITKENEAAMALPYEPFLEEGKLIPIYDGEAWSWRIEKFPPDKVTENCFPADHYRFEEMGDGFHGFAAYADGECAGFALCYENWSKWITVDNLYVAARFRRRGVATALIDAAMQLAAAYGKRGITLVCQNNNLQAVYFYLKTGFTLGGMNLPVYEGTKRPDMADLYLYKRLPEYEG